ncbi:MAG: hypothetical protein M1561_05745 [Gammaproteobacteria bacterium]|nr:hypothetical protein [Gammaproteobacteria bacterium]
MQANNYLSLKRLGLLMKADLMINFRLIVICTISVACGVFLYSLGFSRHLNVNFAVNNFHPGLFFMVLFIGGIWISSNAFKDLHDEKRSYFFLSLPCTSLEKLLSRLLLTGIGYAGVLALGFFLVSALVNVLEFAVYQEQFQLFNPFAKDVLTVITNYLFCHAIVVLGSAYFKRHVLMKIFLALCVLGAIISIITTLVLSLFGELHFALNNIENSAGFFCAKTIITILLAFCCWMITYFRICEAEL